MKVEKYEEIIIKLSIQEATILVAILGTLSSTNKVDAYKKLTGEVLPIQEAHNFTLYSLLDKNLRNHIKNLRRKSQ